MLPEDMSELLFIIPAYPPLLSPATHRPMKFVKYFPTYGICPVVLTPQLPRNARLDYDLQKEVEGISCHRVNMPLDLAAFGKNMAKANWVNQSSSEEIKHTPRKIMKPMLTIRNFLMFPDHMVISMPAFWKKASELVLSRNIKAICTSGPHHSLHLVGLWLKRRLNVPCWVVDFRDAWVNDPKMTFPTPFHRWVNRKMEASVIRESDAVITVSQNMRSDFLSDYPGMPHEKFHTIFNGYDEADFEEIAPERDADGRIHLVHAGTVYERTGFGQVLDCLGRVLIAKPQLKDKVSLDLYGQVHAAAWQSINQQIEKWNLDEVIHFHGCLNHRDAVARILGADWLLLLTGPGKEVVTTKVFEYIRARIPVFTVCESDAEVKSLLESVGTPFLAADRNRGEEICKGIEEMLTLPSPWPISSLSNSQNHLMDISLYSRQAATRQLAEVIQSILAAKDGARS